MNIREGRIMSFKKRLILIFLTITLLPLFLTCLALIFIGSFLNSGNSPMGNGFNLNWAVKSYGQLTVGIARDIDEVIISDKSFFYEYIRILCTHYTARNIVQTSFQKKQEDR